MAVSAIFRGRSAGRPTRRRPPGRLGVIAWAVAATAAMAAAASTFMEAGPAAFALVTRGPDPGASEHGAAPDPITPAQALIDPREFRRPPPLADGRPRVAILVTGLGISASLTSAAIDKLPADISLSFSPYGRMLQKQADAARAAGHEIFVDVPLEPEGYPGNDAGPEAILATLPAAENIERLRWSLARFTGFAGLVLAGKSPALDDPETIQPLLGGASMNGLVWAHGGTRGFERSSVETAEIAVTLDATAEARAIGDALAQLETEARTNGAALAVASSYPVTVERLAQWAEGLEARGFVLVPASALAHVPTPALAAEVEAGAHSAAPEAAHTAPPAEDHAAPDAAHSAASEEAPPPVSDAHGAHH